MKKLISILLLAVGTVAHAGPWDLNIQQYDGGGFSLINRLTVQPAGGVSGVVMYDTSTSPALPKIATLSGLTYSGGVLSVSASSPAWSSLTGTPPPVSTFSNDASYATTSAVALKFDIPAGATTQYVRGNGSLATFPTAVSAFTNDAGYRTQAQVRSDISLTTTGSGAATYSSGTGVLNVPTPAPFNFGLPTARTLAVSTDYQANDPTKAAVIYPSYACSNNTTVLAASACTAQVRMSSSAVTCSTGTVYYTQSLTVNLGVLITQNSTNPVPIFLPAGAHFIICPLAGTFTITAVDQTAN